MIEIVINFDKEKKMYQVYEPTSDTLLVTSSLGESILNLNKFLKDNGMITEDLLQSDKITYHLDSATMVAMIESNVSLMKRLNNAPSGFMISSQKFGSQLGSNQQGSQQDSNAPKKSKNKSRTTGGMFSNSAFRSSYKKFGGSSNF